MPVNFEEDRVRLEGHCGVEEAEPLLEGLQKNPEGVVDMAECTHLHTALFQVLWAWAPPVEGEPPDPFLCAHIGPLLGPSPSTGE